MHRADFLARIEDAMNTRAYQSMDSERIARAVLGVLEQHVAGGDRSS
jgi:hypothetical protein